MQSSQKLSPETTKVLWRVYRQSENRQARSRAHCILLIDSKYDIQELVDILGVSRKTIYNWKNNWSQYKLVGLYNRGGRGRKALLNPTQQEQIRQWEQQLENNSRQLLVNKIREEWGITVSRDTVTRILN